MESGKIRSEAGGIEASFSQWDRKLGECGTKQYGVADNAGSEVNTRNAWYSSSSWVSVEMLRTACTGVPFKYEDAIAWAIDCRTATD